MISYQVQKTRQSSCNYNIAIEVQAGMGGSLHQFVTSYLQAGGTMVVYDVGYSSAELFRIMHRTARAAPRSRPSKPRFRR